jgi:hypothetical protein
MSAAPSWDAKVVHGARPDDRGRDGGVAQHEREGHLNERDAGLVGELGESVGGVEPGLVGRVVHVKARCGAAAEFGPCTSESLR